MPFAATWMDLDFILSEINQRQIYDIAYLWAMYGKDLCFKNSKLTILPEILKKEKSSRKVLENEAKKVGWDCVIWGLEYQAHT